MMHHYGMCYDTLRTVALDLSAADHGAHSLLLPAQPRCGRHCAVRLKYAQVKITMTRQIVDDTMAYVRQELTRISQDMTWADGAEAQRLEVRQSRLAAELDRLSMMRQSLASDVKLPENKY